jgi:hypothetical protein
MPDVYFPGSNVPFRPINPWGRKAAYTNASGLTMPEGWVSPFSDGPRYRVHVDTPSGESQPVTPGMGRLIIDELCATINNAIKAGNVTGWSNPHVLPV